MAYEISKRVRGQIQDALSEIQGERGAWENQDEDNICTYQVMPVLEALENILDKIIKD